MTKKSHKRLTRWRKENVGCMWGLISFFDFRRGRSAQRLLSDKKCVSSRNLVTNHSRNKVGLSCNTQENHGAVESIAHIADTEAEDDSFDAPRKKVMSRTHQSRREFNSKIEWIKAELGIGTNAEKNHKEATKSGVVFSENNLSSSPSLISQQSDYPNMSPMLSPDLDLGEFMLDYCNNGLYWERKQFEYENKTDQLPSPPSAKKIEHDNVSMNILQKAIVDLTEAFLRENSNNSGENKEVRQPKGIIDVLEMLNSNKRLFLELLQDPNSPVRKHIQELQNVHFSKSFMPVENQVLGELPGSKKFQKQSGPYLFMKKDKFRVVSQSNERDGVKGPSTIVVLKPSKVRNSNLSHTKFPMASIGSHCNLENKEGGERPWSHFSLKEFGKRFRNVVGTSKKEKHRIAMDGIMHKIPYGKQISRKNETFRRSERIEHGGEMRSDAKDIQQKIELSTASKTGGRKKSSKNAAPRLLYTEAAFCDEARKHLAEFLRNGSENESLSPIRVSKSFGRILSFPGFGHLSPRHNLAREKEAESLQEQTPSLLFHLEQQKNTAEYLDLSRNKESFPSTDKIQEAKNEIIEIVGVDDKECIQPEEVSQLEVQTALIINEDDLPGGTFKEEESSMLLEPEQSEAIFESSAPSTPIPSSSAAKQEPKDADFTAENGGRPSPVSVLEPLFFEDINVPTSTRTEHAINVETQRQPRESQIDDSAAASPAIDFEGDLIANAEFDEASLFDELEISYGSFIGDPKLLFDSIDDVLAEMKKRHFSCTPWVSFIKPTIWSAPKQEYFMKEASRRMNWHVNVQFPSTLKQAVEKDLDGTAWFDLQFEAENAVGEIGNAILDYLFEETALELWD